ncbi:MAG: tetratricopeptide repeat protein [Planctomycetes bacterium]|nr:tetratricopeptide repeat protein [Planctomycetota bacterium]
MNPLPLHLPPRRRASAVAALLFGALVTAQAPAPGGGGPTASSWCQQGDALLDHEDPVGAWRAFRRAIEHDAEPQPAQIGLGRAHLMLGNSVFACSYAEAALQALPSSQQGMALCVRALIRARAFDEAVTRATSFVRRTLDPEPELLAARASALFRVQRIDEAAAGYRDVIALDPLHAEGHLRLGSGLLPPVVATITADLRAAADAAAAGDLERAISLLRRVLTREPGHPIAHRLLGEALLAERTANSMAAEEPAFRELAAALPVPDVRSLPVGQFVRGYERLSPARRLVVDRTAALFATQLPRLIAVGGSHDLLLELERTTDAEARAALRGRRTFDGRVWDDVRGVGGIQAATGIEALDDVTSFGFDTLAHEVAHQVHLHAFTRAQRLRIRTLYQQALADGRCLDYYAASNEAEYFGQGIEAFVSLGKRPGGETTHGHTRFELYAVDRDLHDFIASVVDHDPLREPAVRERLLTAAVAVAIRCGRPAEAITAASMLPPGERRDRLLATSRRAAADARCH